MDTHTVSNAVYGAGSLLWLCVFVFGVILSILWILVPFAIFGIKGLLRRIAHSLETLERQNNDLLVAYRETPRVAEPVVYRDPRSDAPVVVRDDRTYPPTV
ncbi:hypothetical protein HF319_09325 [Xanthomonas sp. Kuri4-1]